MLKFYKDRWIGNKWASIDITPVDEAYFLPVLQYLMATYNIPKPRIILDVDGCIAEEFLLLSCPVMMGVDTWTFSIAFEQDEIRDTVYDAMIQLPDDYFDS